jgi:hypothetical protein
MLLFRRSAPMFSLAGAALLVAASAASLPAAAADKPAAKPAAKPVLKTAPATSRQKVKSAAKSLALATEVTEAISAGQLDVAARVLTGNADCEFKQTVTVQPVEGLPGYFHVGHQGKRYRMLPRETATGAVRLEDPANGIVWLQIPTKSMLMDAKRGQRMVDSCLHSEQRAAVAAASAAGQTIGQGIGIVPQTAEAPVVAAQPAAATTPVATAPVAAAPAGGAPMATGAPSTTAPVDAASRQ